jgi:hypothetical protein
LSSFQVVTCVQTGRWSDLKGILQGCSHAEQYVFLFKKKNSTVKCRMS